MRLTLLARMVLLCAAAIAPSPTSLAQGCKPPNYGYTKPPYSYQPPAYSYTPPSNSYQPPDYNYTPPGKYRRDYRANTPDYNDAYKNPDGAYGDPRAQNRARRRFGDPSQNRMSPAQR